MKRTCCCLGGVLVVLIGARFGSAAQIFFSQSHYDAAPGSTITVDIMVSSDPPVAIAGTNVFVFLGDGGSAIGGSDNSPPFPHIVDIQIAGAGVFIPTDGQNSPLITPLAAVRTATASNSLRDANGRLAVVTISLVGAAPGNYPLFLAKPDAGFSTELLNNGGNVVAGTLYGTATIGVPEPTSLLLLTWGAGVLPFKCRRFRTATV